MTIEEYIQERNEALLSLDESRIRAMIKEVSDAEMPTDPIVFWGAVHKAITGIESLPIEFRNKSKVWLDANDLSSFDDGSFFR